MINGVDWCPGKEWVCEAVCVCLVREIGATERGCVNQGQQVPCLLSNTYNFHSNVLNGH